MAQTTGDAQELVRKCDCGRQTDKLADGTGQTRSHAHVGKLAEAHNST